MKFVNTDTKVVRDLNDRYVRIPSDDVLAKEFLKPITENKNTKWTFETNGVTKSLTDVVQIKINIKNVGAVMVSFDNLIFTKETKEELFAKLLTLKDIDTTKSLDELKRKVTSVFRYLDEYHPYFVVVNFSEINHDSEFMVASLGWLSYQVIMVRSDFPSLDIVIGPDDPKPEEKDGFFKKMFGKKKDNEPVIETVPASEMRREEPVIETRVEEQKVEEKPTKDGFNFKDAFVSAGKNIAKFKIDYILNVLYSALIGICTLLTVIYFSIDNKGIGALFIGFTAASIALSVYNIFVARNDKVKRNVFDYIFFVLVSIVGAAFGILAGWLIAATFIAKGETVVDFKKVILIGSLITPVCLALAEGISILVLFLVRLIKKNKNK